MRDRLPYVFAGLKVAPPRAISAAVGGEFIAADRGLGYYIDNARAMAERQEYMIRIGKAIPFWLGTADA